MADAGFPLLIAHTPRAGRWNHVALLPGQLPVGTDAAGYLSAAGVPGANYVAVVAAVEQPATGRGGQEILALIGIDVPGGAGRAALEAWLQARLANLGEAVAGFDWDAHPGGPAVLPVLADWGEQAVAAFGLRPHPTRTLAPLRSDGPPTRTGLRWLMWVLVAVLVAVCAALLAAGLVKHCTARPAHLPPLSVKPAPAKGAW